MNLERAAEQSVIGAILHEPAQFGEVREWLEPDDFYGTAERQAFEAMRVLADRGEVISPEAVDQELKSRRTPAAELADGAFVIGCMQRCPESSRAAVYGRMVLELSVRRTVADHATRLRQRAGNAVSSHDLNLVFAGVDAVRRDVERLHQREAQAARAHSPTPLLSGQLAPLTRRPRHDELTNERVAVAALVQNPGALATVHRWLRPGDFGDDECRGLYAQLTALHDAKNPIDSLTLAWRAKKVGLQGPACDALLAGPGSESVAADPVLASRRVLEQSVRAAVVATADELEELAQRRTVNATSQAYARLNNLWPQQRRLVKAGLSST